MGTALHQQRRTRIDRHRELLSRPAVTLVTTTIVPVERSPGKRCPITDSTVVRAVGDQIPDLAVLILDTGERINRWELSGAALERFDQLASKAQHHSVATGAVWHVPIVFFCPAAHVEDLLDDTTQVLYWSGGWRSGKSYRGLQWWIRGWVKYGERGERFWLMGPQMAHAFRLMQKIFVGREKVGPLLPTHNRQPILARGLPSKTTERNMWFEMIDGSIVELQHAHGEGGHLEGESVRRILFDEAWMARSGGPYEVALGRVMEDFGQVGISSVPDEECEWLYESVVAEFDKTKETAECQFKVIELSGYDNPYVDPAAIKRRELATPDETTRANKIFGKWTRRGLYYYADVWSRERQTRDEVSHDAAAWGLGEDITAEVLAEACGRPAPYGGAVDFSDGGRKATTRIWARVFGDLDDWMSWNLVIMDAEQTRSDSIQAASESAMRDEGRYVGGTLVGDAEGFDRGAGKNRRNNDARHWEAAGFKLVAPERHPGKKGAKATYTNPKVGKSRTAVREVMRRGKLWINAGRCPGLLDAIDKAPNRRKLNSDKGTWREIAVYGYEDCLRYLVWRIFSRHQEHKERDDERETNDLAGEIAA